MHFDDIGSQFNSFKPFHMLQTGILHHSSSVMYGSVVVIHGLAVIHGLVAIHGLEVMIVALAVKSSDHRLMVPWW